MEIVSGIEVALLHGWGVGAGEREYKNFRGKHGEAMNQRERKREGGIDEINSY